MSYLYIDIDCRIFQTVSDTTYPMQCSAVNELQYSQGPTFEWAQTLCSSIKLLLKNNWPVHSSGNFGLIGTMEVVGVVVLISPDQKHTYSITFTWSVKKNCSDAVQILMNHNCVIDISRSYATRSDHCHCRQRTRPLSSQRLSARTGRQAHETQNNYFQEAS